MRNILLSIFILSLFSAKAFSVSPRSQDRRVVNCVFKSVNSIFLGDLNTCVVNQTIERENYVLGSEVDMTVEQFYISNNINVKELPKKIGEKFPNLIGFRVKGCGLTVVRSFYFDDMKNLRVLCLMSNKITNITIGTFRDLTNLERLFLSRNLIETIQNNIFSSMVSLQEIYLDNNKIKFLGSTIFEITNGMLKHVDLRSNICVDADYDANALKTAVDLKTDIEFNCTQSKQSGSGERHQS